MDHRQVLESLPLPLARGFRRWRNAAETREAHDAAYYLFEVYIKYTAASAIAEYLAGTERDHKVNAVLKGLARPSLGEWLRFLKECVRFLARGEGGTPSPAISAIAELLERRETRWREVVALSNALRAFRGESGEKEGASLEEVLSEVVSYRNRVLGHGAPLAGEHYERFGRLFAAAFTELLDFSPFLTARRLVAFDSVQVEDGARVECRAIEYMGLHPIRRESPLTLAYGAEAPRKQVLYLLGEDGAFLSLDPLLVAEKEDIYILNHAQGGAEYLSYSSGERHRPSGMDAARGELFERILGYRVDEARLSRMGDDLAEPAGTPVPGALAGFPKAPGSESGTATAPPGYAADLRWLLEGLARGESVRINCGGEDYPARDGRAFVRDRFFLSGLLPGEADGNPYAFTLGIEKTDDDPLYQSQRWFPPELIHPPGYRFPLPPGEYRVTLHFAEWAFRKAGWRSFGALLEGKEVLPEYEPLKAGFATAEAKPLRTRVDDGLLEIEMVPAVNNPIVNAIEIERLE